MKNNKLRYSIATLIISEIAQKGRYTKTSYLEQKAKKEFLQEMVEDDERFFDLYFNSAIDLLKQNDLLKLNENGNLSDLTEEGYNAAKFNSVLDYQRDVNQKKQKKLFIETLSKISPAISTLIALVTAIAGYVTGHITIGIIVTILLIGVAIGFFINESIHKIYGKA